MKRFAPLRTKSLLTRRTRLRAVNTERRKRLVREDYGGKHADWIRSQHCLVDTKGCSGRTVAAHVKSRGAGGKAQDLVPLCWGHHQESHQIGIQTFQQKYRLDLPAIAANLWARSPYGDLGGGSVDLGDGCGPEQEFGEVIRRVYQELLVKIAGA